MAKDLSEALAELKKQMSECEEDYDREGAHHRADDLLKAALLILAVEREDREEWAELVRSYERVEKWFA